MVFNQKHFLPGHRAALKARAVTVGLWRAAHIEIRLIHAVGQSGRMADTSSFDACDTVEVEFQSLNAGGHRFDNVMPLIRVGNQLTVIHVDRGNKAGLQTDRLIQKEVDRSDLKQILRRNIHRKRGGSGEMAGIVQRFSHCDHSFLLAVTGAVSES